MLLSLFLFSTKPTFGTYVLDLLFVGLLESPLLAAAWLGIRGLRQGRYSGATAWAAKALVCLLALMSGDSIGMSSSSSAHPPSWA